MVEHDTYEDDCPVQYTYEDDSGPDISYCIVSYIYKLYYDTYRISKSRIITPIELSTWQVY